MKLLNVGVTGANGFIGSHVVARLRREASVQVSAIDKGSFDNSTLLREVVQQYDVIVHLAGMNRGNPDEIYEVNVRLVQTLIAAMENLDHPPKIIFASSTQNQNDTPYGMSKKAGGELLRQWATQNNGNCAILVIPNVFGEGCKPFYNSVVATFCYQLTRDEQPKIIVDATMELVYVRDLVDAIANEILTHHLGIIELNIQSSKRINVSDLLTVLREFKDTYLSKDLMFVSEDAFSNDLFNVFLSYFPSGNRLHKPKVHEDPRGGLFEVIRLTNGGQIFFSNTKPGIIRGNHYHTRKRERFCVVVGKAIIRLRMIGKSDIIEYKCFDDHPTYVDIPVFHTHHIENVGESDLETIFWCNEVFNPNDPDTFFEEV